jgi:hypothetical protein
VEFVGDHTQGYFVGQSILGIDDGSFNSFLATKSLRRPTMQEDRRLIIREASATLFFEINCSLVCLLSA